MSCMYFFEGVKYKFIFIQSLLVQLCAADPRDTPCSELRVWIHLTLFAPLGISCTLCTQFVLAAVPHFIIILPFVAYLQLTRVPESLSLHRRSTPKKGRPSARPDSPLHGGTITRRSILVESDRRPSSPSLTT